MKPRVGLLTRVVKGKLVSVHVIKACGGVEVQRQIFLTAAIDGGILTGQLRTTAALPRENESRVLVR
jgi:hypothetical protein